MNDMDFTQEKIVKVNQKIVLHAGGQSFPAVVKDITVQDFEVKYLIVPDGDAPRWLNTPTLRKLLWSN